jgi:hypothetical protein
VQYSTFTAEWNRVCNTDPEIVIGALMTAAGDRWVLVCVYLVKEIVLLKHVIISAVFRIAAVSNCKCACMYKMRCDERSAVFDGCNTCPWVWSNVSVSNSIHMLLRFEVLTAWNINVAVFWLVTSIICVNIFQRFGGRGLKFSGMWHCHWFRGFWHFEGSWRLCLQRSVSPTILRNVGKHVASNTASHPRRLESTTSHWEPQISRFGGTSCLHHVGYR